MPGTVDLDSTLLLMQHYLELHRKQTFEVVEKITELAHGVGVERRPGESLEDLVERVRQLTREGFPEEEPPTNREGTPVK